MFEATGWSLEEEGKDNAKFDILMPAVVKPPRTCDLIIDEGQYPYEVGINWNLFIHLHFLFNFISL